jgi:hypothetical protein
MNKLGVSPCEDGSSVESLKFVDYPKSLHIATAPPLKAEKLLNISAQETQPAMSLGALEVEGGKSFDFLCNVSTHVQC